MEAALNGRNLWHVAAAISGATAVGLGAYGSHGFKPKDPFNKKVFERGTEYHLVHTALLALAPIARRPNLVGGLAATGIVLFAGSCYWAAITEVKRNGALAPVGGVAFIFAWLALAL